MADLAELLRTRRQRVQNPSPRTPDRNTSLNNADNIERQLQKDGHEIWGWIIYRCTYASDDQWKAFMDRLTYYIRDTLAFDNGLDLMEKLDFKVIEDQSLDGASPASVRQHFKQWVESNAENEQGGKPHMRSQRYRYCLHVDQAALESVLNGPAPPVDKLGDEYVNIVHLGYLDTDSTASSDSFWMRIDYTGLMAIWYNVFRPDGAWSYEYREPPQIARH